jgi:peptidoglycan/LPS O-acetylase OafA/YrhL
MHSPRFDRLTTLRAFAAWWVVIYHFREPLHSALPSGLFGLISHGFLAVDFFFILSGFIISANYLKPLASADRKGVLLFIYRRLARIYPLHIVLLLMYVSVPLAIWCCSSSGLNQDRFSVAYFIQSIFLLQNWGISTRLDWNIPAWSISTEFAAYLVFAGLALSGLLARLKTVHALIFMPVFWLTIVAVFDFKGLESIGMAIPEMGLLRCVLQFAMGSLLWVILRSRVGQFRRTGLVCLALSLLLIALGWMLNLPDFLLVSPVGCLLIAAFALIPEHSGRGLAWGPLVHLGEISYSTYLSHDLVRQWVKFASPELSIFTVLIYLVLVWIASEVFFRLVENPARDFLNSSAMRNFKIIK